MGRSSMAPDFLHGRAAFAVGRLEAADITNPNCRSAHRKPQLRRILSGLALRSCGHSGGRHSTGA